ncbi:eukaryotic translation initiation factor 4 gamma 2b [Labrus bergylta]|uniref:eukaryotic translation initiation factor 4 gamma 2b n=1 Tax=Labrus bergylta TaxID=56723 RepID=UPI003314104C
MHGGQQRTAKNQPNSSNRGKQPVRIYVIQMRKPLEKMGELAQSHMADAQQQQKSWQWQLSVIYSKDIRIIGIQSPTSARNCSPERFGIKLALDSLMPLVHLGDGSQGPCGNPSPRALVEKPSSGVKKKYCYLLTQKYEGSEGVGGVPMEESGGFRIVEEDCFRDSPDLAVHICSSQWETIPVRRKGELGTPEEDNYDSKGVENLKSLVSHLHQLLDLHKKYNCRLSVFEKGSVRGVEFFMLDKESAPELIAATVESSILPRDELLLQYIKHDEAAPFSPSPPIILILLSILHCQAAKVESVIAEGGASRFSASSGGGGGRGAPQHYPKTVGNSEFLGKTPGQSVQRWVPSRSTRRDVNSSNEKERHDAIFRKVRGILNKLTPEKFDKLCLELLNVGVDSKLVLKGIILLIVDKALEEPKYSSLYAQLCLRLAEDAPNFDGPSSEIQTSQKQSTTFRRLLISKLQDEFENRTRNVEIYDKHDNPLTSEEEEQRNIAKIKMLGNIKFIGELGKLDLIHESILHKCIKTLLEKKKRVQLKDMGEDLECLCQIMRTVGPRLDHEKAKSLMDQYFGRMRSLMNNKELPARIRFLLQDTVELRENNWVPRKAFIDNGPKTINQIRQEAVKDLGVFIPAPMSQGMRMDFFLESPFMPNRVKLDRETLGGLADMFGQMPGSGIGTGPGVIQDRYSPTMGRHRTNPLFNGHSAHIAPQPQSQFEMGPKSFVKSNQVQNQHFINQNQNHTAQQQVQSKDMPPRFSKKGQLNADEISLRPAQSFLLNKNQVPKLQPQIPNMMPPSAQPPRTQTPPLGQPPQLGLKTNPPPIQEKPQKINKKPPPAREELLKMTEAIMTEYLNSKNLTEAVSAVREMKAPKHFLPEMLSKIIVCSLDRPDEDKEHASTLIHTLRTEGLITGENFMQAFLTVLDQCPKIELDVPLVKSYLAQFAARAIIAELVSVAELAHPLENGTHFPLFLLCLQQTAKLKDREWLTDLFQQSKVNMQKMLPEIDQNKDRMLEILEGKGLSFLFPLLKLEKELLKQITADPSPQSIYKWIKDNISPKLHTDKGFVNILMTSFLQYISQELCVAEGDEQLAAPSKEQLEQEKQLLLAFKPVMQKFLHDHTQLQVSALYALQVHCNTSTFPKGMLLRYFVNFYDMEIIEEEAFLAWKEDITQEFPGKGKALFQVNQWLTWLETAEEEESEDDAD